MTFIRCRSHYSIGWGFGSVRSWVDRATDLGSGALLLADRETLAGQPELHARARETGLRALTGLELADDGRAGRLVLVARDLAGYGTLCELVSRRRAALGPAPDAGDVVAAIPEEAPGLFILVDEPRVARALLARRDVDRGSIRLLLTRPAIGSRSERELAAFARATRLPVVADGAATLRSGGDLTPARLARTVLRGAPASEPLHPLPAPDRLRALFADVPEALEESAALTAACTLALEPGPPLLPSAATPPGSTPDAWLRRLTREALEDARRGGDRCRGPAYEQRLEAELDVIAGSGLTSYFLLVREISRVAATGDVPLTLRGSAGASLVAYLLGLTKVDPVAGDLLFERFLNAERRDFPDIDLDVCAERRPLLIEALFEELGRDRVAQIASYQTLGRASVVRRSLTALGATERERTTVERLLPAPELRPALTDGDWRASLAHALGSTRFRPEASTIAALVGLPTHLSVHPGAIVVADRPLALLAPLQRAPKDVPVLQYDVEAASWLGFVKIDVLGNRALTQIRATLDAVRSGGEGGGEGGDPRGRRPRPGAAVAASADPATLALLRSAETIGCFQIETPPMRELLARMSIRSSADVMTALALVRPGPGATAARDAFLATAHAAIPGEPRPLLYEDDVVRAIVEVTGMSTSEADHMRAELVDRGDDAAAVRELERRFLAAAARSGTAPGDARFRWSAIRGFAAYAFNKAHAASYAALAWECAFLRVHAPAEYACAVLDHYGGGYPLRSVASAFVRAGIEIRPPHVARSRRDSHVEPDGSVRLGLRHVKGMTARTGARILQLRASSSPLETLRDFTEAVRPSRGELRALLLSGSLDGLAPIDAAAFPLPHLQALSTAGEQTTLALDGVTPSIKAPASDRDRILLRVRAELRYLEMHPSAHPMDLLRKEVHAIGGVTAARAAGCPPGAGVRFVGIVAASQRIPAGTGVVHFLTLEDETGVIEVVLEPSVERTLRDRISTPGPYLVVGRRAVGALPRLDAQELMPFHARHRGVVAPHAPVRAG